MRGLIIRALKAARLDRATYREVSGDPMAVLHSLGTVVLAGMAIGLGMMGALIGEAFGSPELTGLVDRLFGTWLTVMIVMMGWILWAALIYAMSTLFLRGGAGFRQILRGLGMAYAPAVALVLRPVPDFGPPVVAAGYVWVLVAAVVAVHEAQKGDWLGAALSTALGWFMCFVFVNEYMLHPALSGV